MKHGKQLIILARINYKIVIDIYPKSKLMIMILNMMVY